KQRASLATLMGEVRFNQCAQASDHHLVAHADNDSAIVAMRLDLRRERSRAKITCQKRVVHSLSTVGEFFARRRLGYFEWNSAVRPNLANRPPDGLLRANVGRMILASVNNGNARLTIHKSVKNLFTDGRRSG